MRISSSHIFVAAGAALLLSSPPVLAQYPDLIPGTYTDPETGIDFVTWSALPAENGSGAFTFGMALPGDALTKNATEYIGFLQCQTISADLRGWCGFAHAGHMVDDLLLMAWPHKDSVLTSFRYASGYHMPSVYESGNPTLTQIRSSVNASGYELIYRCQGCFSWFGETGEEGQDGEIYSESVPTAGVDGYGVFGYAQSATGLLDSECPRDLGFSFHDNGFAQWLAEFAGAVSPKYGQWTALATKTVAGSCAS